MYASSVPELSTLITHSVNDPSACAKGGDKKGKREGEKEDSGASKLKAHQILDQKPIKYREHTCITSAAGSQLGGEYNRVRAQQASTTTCLCPWRERCWENSTIYVTSVSELMLKWTLTFHVAIDSLACAKKEEGTQAGRKGMYWYHQLALSYVHYTNLSVTLKATLAIHTGHSSFVYKRDGGREGVGGLVSVSPLTCLHAKLQTVHYTHVYKYLEVDTSWSERDSCSCLLDQT